jgi:hypothetical protein
LKHTTPVSPRVLSRMRAADWVVCCGFCNQEPRCAGWTYAWRWPYVSRNCMLMESFTGLKKMQDRVTQVRRADGPHRRAWAYEVHAPLLLSSRQTAREVGAPT